MATPTAQFLIELADGSTLATIGEGPQEGGSMQELEANARVMAAGPDLRKASQELYDRLQDFLSLSDEQLIKCGFGGLVAAMDAMEAAWHEADGTVPEEEHGKAV